MDKAEGSGKIRKPAAVSAAGFWSGGMYYFDPTTPIIHLFSSTGRRI